MEHPDKYPRTFHWPTSPGVMSDDKVHRNVDRLIGVPVSITEKMDGSNVTLCNGEVYARSTATPSQHAWHGMVRKHHAWKTCDLGPDYKICGEDMYAIHSIEYDGFREDETFRVFNILYKDEWLSFDDRVALCQQLNLKMAPIWIAGANFDRQRDLDKWLENNLKRGSHHGPVAEGFVVQLMDSFHKDDFSNCVAKYVRAGHVQTDQHWSRNWQPCRLLRPSTDFHG